MTSAIIGPAIIDIVVEIPSGTRNKYEFDDGIGRLRLERQLPRSVAYPADYGFVPETLAEDGDPLDALLLIDEPVVPGCIVRVKVLGVLWVSDEHGPDPKLITILPEVADEVGWNEVRDVPPRRLEEIDHFFAVYKDLDTGRSVETHGYGGRDEAIAVVNECRGRFAETGSEATK